MTTEDHEDSPGPLDDLVPPDPLMAMFWWPSVKFTLGNDEMMAAFRTETGTAWEPGRTGLDRMIDKATGAELDFFRAFLKWHNDQVWGDINLRAGEYTEDDE